MATVDLSARPRIVIGKKVKTLRRAGIVPANIYGNRVESTPIQVPVLELRRVLRASGHTGLIRIALDGEAAPRTVVVRQVQRQYTTGNYVHVDFQQVSMSEKMTVRVPVTFVGDAPITLDGGIVVQALDSVELECLPGDIPNHIEAHLDTLTTTGSTIHVSDLVIPDNVTLLTPGDQMVAMVSSGSTEEEGTEVAAETEEAEAEGAAEKPEAE